MRIATEGDVELVTRMIATAFEHDPLWGPALKRPDGSTTHHVDYWRFFVEGALPQGHVFLADGDAAVALWIPPGGSEMSDEQEEGLRALVVETLDVGGQDAIFALWDRFDTSHPTSEPHAYLSLLATEPAHRGHGIAQALVRENLAEFDRQGIPTYLESSNPANDHRYERLGYSKVGEFAGSTPGAIVSTMWRAVP